ncbi:MAG: hypothetical protein K8R21_13895 [Leptospira sp.]|nr:hypothetical protein [Leptospira sp.]
MKLNHLRFTVICLILIALPRGIKAENQYKKGILILKNGKAIEAEYIETEKDFFARDKEKGRSFSKSEVLDIVSGEYFQKIKESSPLKSAGKSILFLNSAAEYQWYGEKGNSGIEDVTFRVLKISLILLTGYFYSAAHSSNEALKNSYTGVNSGSAEAKFHRNYLGYQIAGALTLLTFSYTAVKAFVRFGHNEKYEDLGIQGRNPFGIKEYIESEKNLNRNFRQNYFEFAVSKNF